MMHIRKFPALVAAAVGLVMTLSACGGGGAGSTSASGPDKLVYGTGMIYTSMDPHKSISAVGDCQLTCLIYDRLVHSEPDGTLVAGLAESWEFSNDGKTFTLHLREGVTFDDGTPVDAEAVKVSLDRARTLEGSTVKADLMAVSEVTAADDRTVELSLTAPNSTLPGVLSTVTGAIVNPKAIESGADLSTMPDGTGPFDLVSYTADKEMVLERDDNYWGEKPALRELVIKWIKDPSALANALLAGQVDAADLQPANLAPFEGNDQFEMESATTLGQASLIVNFPLAELTDERVRQGILHAIDREGNCENILHGYCEVSDQPFPEGYFANDDSTEQILYPYDPDKAKALLAEAGVDQLSLEAYVTSSSFMPLAQAVQEQLKAVGVSLDVKTIDTSTMAQKLFIEKSLPAVLTPFSGRPDPAITLSGRYTAAGFYNPGGYSEAEVEELALTALTTTDEAAREPILKEASRAVAESAVGMVMYHPVVVSVRRQGVDFPVSVSGIEDLRAATNTGG